MAINLISPSTFTSAVLIGDTISVSGGSDDTTPSMTKVGNPASTISACLELQSTTGALCLPRMTVAQIAALPNVVDGMMAYATDYPGLYVHSNGQWGSSLPSTATVNLTSANITGMYATPVQVLPAPGAGKSYLIFGFGINYTEATAAYTAGGNVTLQFGNTAHAAAGVVTNTIANTVFNSATNTLAYATGSGVIVTGTQAYVNTAVYISNASGAFATGAGTAVLVIYYSVISAV